MERLKQTSIEPIRTPEELLQEQLETIPSAKEREDKRLEYEQRTGRELDEEGNDLQSLQAHLNRLYDKHQIEKEVEVPKPTVSYKDSVLRKYEIAKTTVRSSGFLERLRRWVTR